MIRLYHGKKRGSLDAVKAIFNAHKTQQIITQRIRSYVMPSINAREMRI